ncbi:hypothetical protein I79_017396 [Cricetulus griseus]|uniref:Uncharacterized protein n=1 Tax=Cricetulus griseus TaxID=10029 RepID=G3I1Y2_CRIGR|nr:hypothetical protein I79_017396 [Cricetulus griseus]
MRPKASTCELRSPSHCIREACTATTLGLVQKSTGGSCTTHRLSLLLPPQHRILYALPEVGVQGGIFRRFKEPMLRPLASGPTIGRVGLQIDNRQGGLLLEEQTSNRRSAALLLASHIPASSCLQARVVPGSPGKLQPAAEAQTKTRHGYGGADVTRKQASLY